MKRTLFEVSLVIMVSGLVFLTNLGTPRLWDRDEPRNAGCAAEMLAANDWVTPVFNGELRTHKPILLYWFVMASYTVFGVTEFAARFPNALLGIGTALATYWMGRRLFSRSVGVWAAIALSTTIMFSVASRAVTPDAPLIFFSTLALAIYVHGTTADKGESKSTAFARLFPSWPVASLMYAVMGIGILAKGPIGLVLPTAVIGMYLLIARLPERPRPNTWGQRVVSILSPFAPLHFLKTCWFMRPVTAIVCSLVIALPWYVLVHIQTNGEWTRGFFLTHNLSRATAAMEGHVGGPWFYPVAILVGFFPWTIFWLPVAMDSVKQLRSRAAHADGYLFAISWVGVYVGLFTLAQTKLPSYITPCYPALALLVGLFMDRLVAQQLEFSKFWYRAAFGSLAAIGLGVTIGLPVAAHYLLGGHEVVGVLGLIMLCGGIAGLYFSEQNQLRLAGGITAVTATGFVVCLMSFVAVRVDHERPLAELVASVYGDEDHAMVDVASLGQVEPTCVFYCRQVIEPFDNAAAAASFLQTSSEKRPVIIAQVHRLPEIMEALPEGTVEVTQVPVLLNDNLAVIRPRARAEVAHGEPSQIR